MITMILRYIAKKDFEIVPELGGKIARPGDEFLVRNKRVFKALLKNGRWEDAGKKTVKKATPAKVFKTEAEKPMKKESDS
jgi:hypothetical protein